MKVTQIKQQVKDANRVSIFVDGVYSFSLSLDQLLEQKIKKGLELSDPDIDRLKKLSNEEKVRARALEWLFIRPHSAKEFREYCFRKKIDTDLAGKLLQDFTDRGYIDDKKFAQWFSEQRFSKGKKSVRAVRAELAAKGVDSSLVHSVVNDRQSEHEVLGQLIVKMRTRTRYRNEKKLIAYLISKGFAYGDIMDVLRAE